YLTPPSSIPYTTLFRSNLRRACLGGDAFDPRGRSSTNVMTVSQCSPKLCRHFPVLAVAVPFAYCPFHEASPEDAPRAGARQNARSEEHTSELQSRENLV